MIEKKPCIPAIWLSLLMKISRWWFFWIFVINVCLYIYKRVTLPYAGSYFGLEITYYIFWGITTYLKYQIGIHALARCEPSSLFFFAISSLFAILACNFYFVYYQSYILRLELIFNAFCMTIGNHRTYIIRYFCFHLFEATICLIKCVLSFLNKIFPIYLTR